MPRTDQSTKGGEKKKKLNQGVGIRIDISKKKADVCIKTESKVLESFVVSNDVTGIKSLQQKIRPYKKQKLRITMESTANMWIVMYESLEEQKLDISLANPIKTRVR